MFQWLDDVLATDNAAGAWTYTTTTVRPKPRRVLRSSLPLYRSQATKALR